MLERVRRLLRTQDPPEGGDERRTGPSGEQTLAEGVYAGPGRIAHYALDGRTRMLCGKPTAGLHRWASSWSFVEPAKRCKRCDALIGDRANERHGAPTVADTLVFGVEPEGLSPRQRAEFRAAWERDAPRRQGDTPPPAGARFSDPPFIYAKDPTRRRSPAESTYDRPINDVYTRVGKGKKWHRVYEIHAPNPHAALVHNGRSFLLPCGNVGFEFERDDDGALYPAPLRTDAPPPAELCKACAQSDAKYGRLGDLPTDRWDR